MTDRLPTLILIAGPTAIGKTRLAIELALQFNAEIISCDSRQVYRELNIGVARPSEEELRAVPHHLVGFLPVTEPYNAYRFETDAISCCGELFRRSDRVIMTGGSGLYMHAVTHGIDELPDPDPAIRLELKQILEEQGAEPLRLRLQRLDPTYYREVDQANPNRLLRALEVCISTGRPYSSLRTGKPVERPFRVLKIGLHTPREILYDRINRRVDRMMEQGLLEEVHSLLPYRNLNALNTVGYTELFAFLDGTVTLAEAVEKIRTHSRRYAKRQLTWFRRDPGIQWFDPDDLEGIRDFICGTPPALR